MEFIKKILLSLLVILFYTGCHAQSMEKQNTTENILSKSVNTSLEDGVYYSYQTCAKRNVLPENKCKSSKELTLSPHRNSDGKLITGYGLGDQGNEFYLIKNHSDSSINFSFTFMEGWAVGWAKSIIKEQENHLTIEGSSFVQTDGIPLDGTDSLDINYFETKAKRVIGTQEKGLLLPYKFLINFTKLNSTEFTLNCDKYHKKNESIGIDYYNPITELCGDGIAQIWFKKVDSVPPVNSLNHSLTSEQNPSDLSSAELYLFKNFPTSVYTGVKHGVFKDALHTVDVSKQNINFAGHFVVLRLDLGFDTTYYQIYDVITGKSLPLLDEKNGFPSSLTS